MLGRLAPLAILITLAACGSVEPVGRTARAGERMEPPASSIPAPAASSAPVLPPPTRSEPTLPPPARSAPVLPPPGASSAPPPAAYSLPAPNPPAVSAPAGVEPPPVAAPTVAAPAADRPPPRDDGENVVVPGQVQRQVRPPSGDPRTVEERMQDINAWDRCVTHVQDAYDSDPMRPQLDSLEDYCSRSLGMADRNAVPISRTQRRSR